MLRVKTCLFKIPSSYRGAVLMFYFNGNAVERF